jgi:hypothetical protein
VYLASLLCGGFRVTDFSPWLCCHLPGLVGFPSWSRAVVLPLFGVCFISLCMFSLSGLVFVSFSFLSFCMVYYLCLISLSLVVCFSLLFPWVVFLWSCLYSSPYVYIVLSLFVLFSCFFVSMFCLFVLFSLCLFYIFVIFFPWG